MRKFNSLALFLMTARAFENTDSPGWRMEGDKIAMKDGNPIWVNADGSEGVIQGTTIAERNAEAKRNRERAERAEANLKTFEGLDPVKAKEALEKLSKIDQKTLIDSGEVDKVRHTIKTEYDGVIAEKDKTIATQQSRLDRMVLDRAFETSEYIRENIAAPADMFRDSFGKYFKVENEKIMAIDSAGNPINSKTRIGEPATFEEAVAYLVENYSQKDRILKAPDQRGTGNTGDAGSRGKGRRITQAQYKAMSPSEQHAAAAAANKGEAVFVE